MPVGIGFFTLKYFYLFCKTVLIKWFDLIYLDDKTVITLICTVIRNVPLAHASFPLGELYL